MAYLTKCLRLSGAVTRRQRLPPHSRIPTTNSQSQLHHPTLTPSAHRLLSTFSRLGYPRKDSQDKDSINTEATEYSKSATDDEGARQEEAAFNPNITDPQEENEKAGESTGVSLDLLSVDRLSLGHCASL